MNSTHPDFAGIDVANLSDAQAHIKKLKVSTHDKEGELKATHTKIKKHEKQFDEAADKKAYDALQHEIAAERAAAVKIEEEILAGIVET